MIKAKESVLNGLLLNGSRPLHPLLAEYLALKGCDISYKDGYIIIGGSYNLPYKQKIFAELIELSKELYGEVNFDIDVKATNLNNRSFEVVDKNPNKEAKISTIKLEGYDQEIVDLLFIEYLLLVNSVVYLGANREICYLAGDEPLNKKRLIAEAAGFIKDAIVRMNIQQNKTPLLHVNDYSNSSLDIVAINPEFSDLLMFKYFLENNCQVFLKGDHIVAIGGDTPHDLAAQDRQMEEFQAAEFAKLQANGLSFTTPPEAPGIFAAFSNWVLGGPEKTLENAAGNTPKPKP